MTYTYAEPSGGVFASQVSEVRFLLADTTPAAPFSLADSEIQYLLVKEVNSSRLAAADAAYKMGQAYTARSSTTSKQVGNLMLAKNYGDAASRYYKLSSDLRRGHDIGSSVAPAQVVWDDTVPQQFSLGQFDNLRAWTNGT